jgi:hypothetical protein
MTAILSPDPVQKFFDANGAPLAFGKLATYAAGTTTPQATYVDSTQTTPNTNPVNLNFRGECNLWLDPTLNYKFVLTDFLGNQIWTVDNIPSPISLGTSVSWSSDTFTATDGQTVFPLSAAPTSLVSALVTLDGSFFVPTINYTISGSTLTLTTPAILNQVLYVSYLKNIADAFNQTFIGKNNDVENIFYHRLANYAGGISGFVNSTLRVTSDVTQAGSGPFEWNAVFVMNNSSTSGEQNALYAQGNRMTATASETWSATFESIDHSGVANPNIGLVGIEIDIRASGTDTNFSRVGCDQVVTRNPPNTGATMHAYCAFRTQNGGDNQAIADNCYAVQNSVFGNGFTIFGVTGTWGLNFGTATLTSGAALFPTGAPICFDSNAFTALYWDTSGLRFDYGTSGRQACFRANNDGTISFGGSTLPWTMKASTSTGGAAAVVTANKPGASTAVSTWAEIDINGTAFVFPLWLKS